MGAMQTEVFRDVPGHRRARGQGPAAAAALTPALPRADDETTKAFTKRDGDIDAIRRTIASSTIEVATVRGDVILLKGMVGFAITPDLTILAKPFSP